MDFWTKKLLFLIKPSCNLKNMMIYSLIDKYMLDKLRIETILSFLIRGRKNTFMKMKRDDVRNVAIIAHVDHGKYRSALKAHLPELFYRGQHEL